MSVTQARCRLTDIHPYSMEQSSSSTNKGALQKASEGANGTSTLNNSAQNAVNLTISSFNPPGHGKSTDAWSRMTKKEAQTRSPEEELQSLIDKGSPALQFLECIKEEKSVELVADSRLDESIEFAFELVPEELGKDGGQQSLFVEFKIPSKRSQKLIDDFKDMLKLEEQQTDEVSELPAREDPRVQEIKDRYSNARSRERERKSSIGRQLEESRSQENKQRLSLRQNSHQGRIHSRELRRSDLSRASSKSQTRRSLQADKPHPVIEQTFAKPKQEDSAAKPRQFTLVKRDPPPPQQQPDRSAREPQARPKSKNFAGSPIKALEQLQQLRQPSPVRSASQLQTVKWQFHRNFVKYSELPGPVHPDSSSSRAHAAAQTPKLLSFRADKENLVSNAPQEAPRFAKNLEFKPLPRRESTAASSSFSLGSQPVRSGMHAPLGAAQPLKRKHTETSTTDSSTTAVGALLRDKSAQQGPGVRPPAPGVLQPRLDLQRSTPKSRPPTESNSRPSGGPSTRSGARVESCEGVPETPSAKKSKPLLALCTPQTLLFASSSKEAEELYEFSLSSHPSDEFEEKFYIQKKDSLGVSEQKNEQRILSYEDRPSEAAALAGASWKRGEVGGLRELADRSVGRAKIQVKRAGLGK